MDGDICNESIHPSQTSLTAALQFPPPYELPPIQLAVLSSSHLPVLPSSSSLDPCIPKVFFVGPSLSPSVLSIYSVRYPLPPPPILLSVLFPNSESVRFSAQVTAKKIQFITGKDALSARSGSEERGGRGGWAHCIVTLTLMLTGRAKVSHWQAKRCCLRPPYDFGPHLLTASSC